MNCPYCQAAMKICQQSTSYNHKENNKAYTKTIHVCRTCDAWITLEVPETSSPQTAATTTISA